MTIHIRRFEPADVPAITRLNQRLADHGVSDRVWPESTAQTKPSDLPITKQLYVAVEGDEVRGGVWLHEHEFIVCGRKVTAGWLKYPVAESLTNRSYGGVPAAMIVWMMRRQPNLMALGMGGREGALARLLLGIGWGNVDIPFYIAPVRASRVLRELPHLRARKLIGRLAAFAGHTRLASVGASPFKAYRLLRTKLLTRGVTVDEVQEFGPWADEIWNRHKDAYAFIARRDCIMLEQFYSTPFPGLTRLRLRRHGKEIGWLCTTIGGNSNSASRYDFGNLKVGLLVDDLADPADAPVVLAAGFRYLRRAGADLIVTNQIHPAWMKAARSIGFLPAPSNFLFAFSKPMAKVLAEAGQNWFINRGDCDGPPMW